MNNSICNAKSFLLGALLSIIVSSFVFLALNSLLYVEPNKAYKLGYEQAQKECIQLIKNTK